MEKQPDFTTKGIEPLIDIHRLALYNLDIATVRATAADDRENELRWRARDNCQMMIDAVYKLRKQTDGDAIVASVTTQPVIRVPRAKPIPKATPATKWEKYAQMKGIQKRKTPRKVFDEVSKEWKPAWGYGRAQTEKNDWVVEIPRQKDPYKDYFEERSEQKKERVAKNEYQRLKNIARSEKEAVAATPADPRAITVGANEPNTTEQFSRQIRQVRESTASLGKFEKTMKNEKAPKDGMRKRKFQENSANSLESEKKHSLQLLKRLNKAKPVVNVARAVGKHQAAGEAMATQNKKTGKQSQSGKPGGKKGMRGSKSNRRQQMHLKNRKKNPGSSRHKNM